VAGKSRKNSSSAGPPQALLHLRMASRREAVAAMVERILKAVQPVGLSEDRRANFAVAITEALSNAAVHGNRLHPDRKVVVTVTVDPGDRASVEVKDSGPGFDASAVADPTEPSRVMKTGGRGVFLMRRLVDRAEFNQSGNCVCLTMFHSPK